MLGALVDTLHALLMVTWIAGLPLLFWHKWPRVTRAYGMYAVAFVVVSRGSHLVLGECFLTTLAKRLWESGRAVTSLGADEWFTVRFAELVFGLTPSHRAIAVGSEVLVIATAVGVLWSLRRSSFGNPPRMHGARLG